MDAKVSAKRAKLAELFMHLVVGVRNMFLAEIEAIDPVNSTRDRTVVITIRAQSHPETLCDPATVPVVTLDVFIMIFGCIVERREIDLDAGRLGGVFNQDVSGDLGQARFNLVAVPVRYDCQSQFWIVLVPIFPESTQHFVKLGMQTWLAAQHPDAVPLVTVLDAFLNKGLDLLQCHALVGRCLAAGPVTARALEIADIRQVDLNQLPAAGETRPQNTCGTG